MSKLIQITKIALLTIILAEEVRKAKKSFGKHYLTLSKYGMNINRVKTQSSIYN